MVDFFMNETKQLKEQLKRIELIIADCLILVASIEDVKKNQPKTIKLPPPPKKEKSFYD
jgi:hypothetical protein